MFIKYSGTNIHALGHIDDSKSVASGPKAIHWFRPGWNEFPQAIWKMYENHPDILKMIQDKKLELLNEKVTTTKGKKKTILTVGMDDKPIDLKDFSEARAIAIVKDVFNRDILQRWLDEDTRHKVKRALEIQIKPLRNEKQESEKAS